jgi:hypothetical protein
MLHYVASIYPQLSVRVRMSVCVCVCLSSYSGFFQLFQDYGDGEIGLDSYKTN